MPRQYQVMIARYAPARSKTQAEACFQAIVVVRTDSDQSSARILCNSARQILMQQEKHLRWWGRQGNQSWLPCWLLFPRQICEEASRASACLLTSRAPHVDPACKRCCGLGLILSRQGWHALYCLVYTAACLPMPHLWRS